MFVNLFEDFTYDKDQYSWQCQELVQRVHKEEFEACCSSDSATPN